MTTTDTTPEVLVNGFGTPYKFQNMQQWQEYLNNCLDGKSLDRACSYYREGAIGHCSSLPWLDGTPESQEAFKALFRRAKVIGVKYSKVSRKFV
jgi:hypothetical protein